ncbi:MAG: hypothetical protein CHACPFDD_03696 [Phycisphaerae bacterium]|nr:hypothetical protein [Phycisphaerae bacterium]
MKVVLVMFKDGERRDFPLTDARTVIGRRSDCSLRVPTGDVSRRHCEVDVIGDEIVVRDLGSANGTYVNGKRIAESELEAGDHLAVGPVHFVVQVDGKPADVHPPTDRPTVAAATPAAPAKPGPADEGEIELNEDDLFTMDDSDLDELSTIDIDDDDEKTRPRK